MPGKVWLIPLIDAVRRRGARAAPPTREADFEAWLDGALNQRGYRRGGGPAPMRENLAAALALCLDHPNTVGKTFSLLDGETPLAEALAAV